MRLYTCKGREGTMTQGKVYEVKAKSNGAAKLLAGQLYLEETEGVYPVGFYAMYFSVRVADPKPPGKTSVTILPRVLEEVPACLA